MAGSFLDSTKPLLWYDHYQGAVYPLDLTVDADSVRMQRLGQPSCLNSDSRRIPSLVHICSNYIVRDSTMTRQAIDIVPTSLFLPLIQEALLSNKDRALQVLVSHWPTETLSLTNLVPNIFASVLSLYNTEFLSDIVRRGLMCTTNLANAVIQRLQEKALKSKLKYLDMTGYPTAEIILHYLANNCLLAHKEQAMAQQINRMLAYSAMCTSCEVDNVRYNYVLPQDSSLLIKFDAFVTSWSSYTVLCKALKVSSFDERNLRLCIQRLHISCLGDAAIGLLLKLLDSEHLFGLQLKYNSLNGYAFVKLTPVLKTLSNLTALDLSCNRIYFWNSDDTCLAAAEAFGSLRKLIRLDLSNNRIKTKLRRLLADIHAPLQYLRLAGCGLKVSDITYLSLSHHTSGLQELDLSENDLGQSIRNLCLLLTSCGPRLKVLQLQECYLSDSHINELLQNCLSQLQSLLYLNIADNIMSWDVGQNVIRTLSRLHTMQVVKFPFPRDLYQVEDEDVERQKIEFGNKLSEMVGEECVKLGMSKPLHLVLCDLEVTLGPVEGN